MTVSNIKYVSDADGKKTAVLIPIKEWEEMESELRSLKQEEILRNSLTNAMNEVELIQKGELPKKSIEDLLDEL